MRDRKSKNTTPSVLIVLLAAGVLASYSDANQAAAPPDQPHQIDIGSTDFAVRGNVIGRLGIESEINSLEDLRGKRIG